MTSKTESQLMVEIDTELNTLLNKFTAGDTALAALLVTLSANIGVPTLADYTADLLALDAQCDLVLAQNP